MRVAYVLPASTDPTSSVGQKIERTLDVWNEIGVEHRLFTLGPPSGEYARDWRASSTVLELGHDGWHNELRRQVACRGLADAVLQWSPDVVYSRIFLFAPALDRLHRRAPLVHEVNTDDVVEFPMYASRLSRLHPPTRHLTLRRVDGFVFVTGELSSSPSFSRYDVPGTVIANGIDLRTVKTLPAPANPRPRVVFLVGTLGGWTGVDKFGLLARLLPEFDFDLVGEAPPDLRFPPNLRTHGYLVGDELETVLSRADVALGTLALHRKSMDEACTLKVRECLARGIPMILAHRDTDLPSAAPYLSYLPNRQDNVVPAVDQIRTFVRSQVGRRVPRSATEVLDLRKKERDRLGFVEKVLSSAFVE